MVPQKTVVGYINIKQQGTYEKLKTEVDKVSDTDIIMILLLIIMIILLLLNTVTATATTNNNNYNNDVIIIKIIITIKMKSGCAFKKLKVAIYIVRLISYLFGEKTAP